MKECIQVTKRYEVEGLGQSSKKNGHDLWNANNYNSILSKIQINKKNKERSRSISKSSSSSDSKSIDSTKNLRRINGKDNKIGKDQSTYKCSSKSIIQTRKMSNLSSKEIEIKMKKLIDKEFNHKNHHNKKNIEKGREEKDKYKNKEKENENGNKVKNKKKVRVIHLDSSDEE